MVGAWSDRPARFPQDQANRLDPERGLFDDTVTVYGARKVHAEGNRCRAVNRGSDGTRVAQCTERLMRAVAIQDLRRGTGVRTTQPADNADRPAD